MADEVETEGLSGSSSDRGYESDELKSMTGKVRSLLAGIPSERAPIPTSPTCSPFFLVS